MTIKKLLFTLLLAAVISSCANQSQDKSSEAKDLPVIQKIEVQINEGAFSMNNRQVEATYIILETTASNALGRITRLVFFDEYIVVLDDRSKLLLFNKDGSYNSEICKVGRGPGESLRTSDVLICEKDSVIEVLDSGSQKLIRKGFNLETIAEYKIPFFTSYFIKSFSGDYWFFMNNQINYTSNSNLIKTNFRIEEIDSLLPIEIHDLIMEDLPSFSRNDKGAVFSLPLDNSIYQLNGDDLSKYEISFGKHNLPVSYTQSLKQPPNDIVHIINTLNQIDETNYASYIASVLENDNYLYFQYSKTRKHYAAFFNKNTQSVEDGRIQPAFRQPLILNDNNQLISALYPYEYSKIKELGDASITEELKNILERSSDNDNPIIEILQLK